VAVKVNPLAGKPADPSMLVNIPRLVTAYFAGQPDPSVASQRVAFGTSGHRGSAFNNAFNENHILAISQAVCDHRNSRGITGPMFVGIDTHALAEPALASALEVFAANGVEAMVDEHGGYTPTPVISRAIIATNKGRENGLADGVVITPSHNPPEDGGFKYNPPNGGPADTDITAAIERAANGFLEDDLRGVKRIPYDRARKSAQAQVGQYMQELLRNKPADLADMKIAAAAGITAYLKQAKVRQFFSEFAERFRKIGHSWGNYSQHGKILDEFEDVGGLDAVPSDVRVSIVLWMVRCYIGEPGGYGMGINRPVFYSNVGAPRIEAMFRQAGDTISEEFEKAANEKVVKAAVSDKHIARRLERLRDLIGPESE